MSAYQPPMCESRPRPHGVSSWVIPDRGVVAIDPRVIDSHPELYLAMWREVFDANQEARLARMKTRKAA